MIQAGDLVRVTYHDGTPFYDGPTLVEGRVNDYATAIGMCEIDLGPHGMHRHNLRDKEFRIELIKYRDEDRYRDGSWWLDQLDRALRFHARTDAPPYWTVGGVQRLPFRDVNELRRRLVQLIPEPTVDALISDALEAFEGAA